MDWYCSGHGVCSFNAGPGGYVQREIVAWFDRYVKGDATVDTGAGFEYVTQDGTWHQATGYPVPGTGVVTGSGSGVVAANGEPTAGGVVGVGATAAHTALEVPLTGASGTLVGAPTITLTEMGAGGGYNRGTAGVLFFQLVDKTANVVLGNQITPKVLPTDGADHTVTFGIEPVSYTVPAGDQIVLQVVSNSANYDVQRGAAAFDIKALGVSVPSLP
jgi:ABC-2 type transport system ATP-binding protein